MSLALKRKRVQASTLHMKAEDMTKNIKIIAVLATAVITCSSQTQASDEKSLNLRPGKVHESCHKLDAGSKINYSFQVSSETLFNLHYHMDKEIKYPVAEQQALKDSGTVYINTTQTYCLMWTNPQEHTVTLRYNIDTAKR